MSLGERLFELRQKRRDSLQEVADAIGISKAHVWELEKGRSRNPSFDIVQKLADYFGVTPATLTGSAAVPEEEQLQIARIHRGLKDLSERDRTIVEQMVEQMRAKPDPRE